jgi:hypothetical protein
MEKETTFYKGGEEEAPRNWTKIQEESLAKYQEMAQMYGTRKILDYLEGLGYTENVVVEALKGSVKLPGNLKEKIHQSIMNFQSHVRLPLRPPLAPPEAKPVSGKPKRVKKVK